MTEITDIIKKKINGLSDNSIVMLETSGKNAQKVNLKVVGLLTKSGRCGVVLTFSRTCVNLLKSYKKGADVKKIIIICGACAHQNQKEQDQVIHVQNATALTKISIILTKTLGKLQEESCFVYFDSVSILSTYNDPKTLSRFIHSTLTKMRDKGVSGFLVAVEKEMDKKVRSTLAPLCDEIIKI